MSGHKRFIEKNIVTEDALKRVNTFVSTNAFVDIGVEPKKKIAAFLVRMERGESAESDYNDRDMIMANVVDDKVKKIEDTINSLCETRPREC